MVQVTHVRQQDGAEDRHVSMVRWYEPSTGKVGDTSVAKMVEFLHKGNRAYVCDGAVIVDVKTVDAKPPYIRTVKDGRPTNNLAALPKF